MKKYFLIVIVLLICTSIKSQKIYTLCEAIGEKDAGRVEYLNISNSRIGSLEFLKKFKNLKYLDASGNRPGFLMLDLHFPKLEKLILNDNDLLAIVITADSVPNLRELYLANCSIKKLDSSFFKGFEKLKKVDLSDNSLNELPASIFDLKNIEELDISSNYYIQIKHVFQSKRLRKITARFCYFKQIPVAIQQIKYFESLDVSHNQIEEVKLCPECLVFIQTIDISFNQLESIDFISELENIKYFQGRRNKIKKLPKSLNLTLTLFDVSYNRISTFNSHHLDSIEYFLIANNYTSQKSLSITLTNNKYIDLRGNNIKVVNFINKRNKSLSTNILLPKHTLFEIDEPDNRITFNR